MTYLMILGLGLLLAINHLLARNLLYPPSLFTAVWLVNLLGIALSGDTFYPISAETLTVFLVGALAFSAGGLAVFSLNARQRQGLDHRTPVSPTRRASGRKLLDFALLGTVIGLPYYWHYITSGLNTSSLQFLAALRTRAVEAELTSQHGFSITNNLVVISQFLAMAMFYENDGSLERKWRAYLAIILALIYGGMEGTKGNAVNLVITLTFISFMRARRINYAVLAGTLAVALLLFAGGLLLINFSGVHTDASLATFQLLGRTVQNYWLGGLVAFDRVVQSPTSIQSTQQLGRFFLEVANIFGARYPIPSINAEYTSISGWQDTNTYTMYFSYFNGNGWLGIVFGMSVLGGVLTWIYNFARLGYPIAIIIYGVSAKAIVLSFHAEHFVLELYLYLRLMLFLYLIYYTVSRHPYRRFVLRRVW